jgi:CHAT domain-containing protein
MLSDLLYEHLPATQLIVLSGCETGSGKLYQGEGVFSFNRGFAAIGIPSCIANLWQVENTSTYQLTELFHKNLAKGMPLDLALQEAKKEFIKNSSLEKQLPFYWAAPILTGRTDAIEFQRYNTWKYLVSGIVLFGLALIGIQLWRRKPTTKSL